ncbi:hypothetical protein J7L48_03185 [bacterium]|nr:hypothetical protein [bacterium]
MRLEKDYEDLLKLLNKNKVEYCIVGAFAMAEYSIPRFTKDMDILINPIVENAKKIIKALKEFGFTDLNINVDDFSKKGQIIQLGFEPIRIDILTSIDGCDFNEIWKNKIIGKYGHIKVFFIGLNELIKNKQATNRKQDQADLEILITIKNNKKKK